MVNYITQIILIVSAAVDLLFDCLFITLLINRLANLADELDAEGQGPDHNFLDPIACGQYCSSLQNEYLVTYRIYVSAVACLTIASFVNLYWLGHGEPHRVANHTAAGLSMMFEPLWPDEYEEPPDKFYAQLQIVVFITLASTVSVVYNCLSMPYYLLLPLYNGKHIDWDDTPMMQVRHLGLSNATFAWTGWRFWTNKSVSSSVRASLCLIIGVPHFLLVWLVLVLRSLIVFVWRVAMFSSMIILLVSITLSSWLLGVSSSELNYYFFGLPTQQYHWNSTVSGLLSEDLAQIIIQVTYAVISTVSFRKHISWVQWSSFAFTIWRLTFSLSYKWMNRDKEPMRVFLFKANSLPAAEPSQTQL